MAGPTTESLATDFRDISREMAADRSVFANYREESAKFQARSEAQLAMIKWVGVFFSTFLFSLVGSAIWLAGHASALTQHVDGLEKASTKTAERLDRIELKIEKMDRRLERVELAIEKLGKSIEKTDQRMEKMEQSIEAIKAKLSIP